MTLGTPVVGAIAGGSSAVTPTIPDGAVGDVLLFVAEWGTPTAASGSDRPTLTGGVAAAAISGYLGSAFGGAGAWGDDVGPRGVSAWMCYATSATGATDAVTMTNTGSGTDRTIGGHVYRYSRDTSKTVVGAATAGVDTNTADGWAPTGMINIGATVDDQIMIAMAGAPSTPNPTPALAWTGCTLNALTAGVSTAVTPGFNVRVHSRTTKVTAGTSTGAPAVTSGTTGTAGAQLLVRLRETSSPPVPTITGGTPNTAIQNDTVPLRGTATDADGTIASTTWDVTAWPSGVTDPAVTNPSSLTTASFKPLAPGSYTVRLTAVDNSGLSAYVEKTITVTELTAGAQVGGNRYVYTNTGWR